MTTHEVALPDFTGFEIVDAKQMVRSAIRARRAKLTPKDVAQYSDAFASTISTFVADAKTVAMYVSVNNEPDTLAAISALKSKGVRILLPKLGPGLSRMWAEYVDDDLVIDAPGRPPAPRGEALPSEAVEDADVIVVPALAVDPSGIRLGQGGGWYDRILKLNVTDKVGAVIYPWEHVTDPLPSDEQDVHVSWVLHPDEIIKIDQKR